MPVGKMFLAGDAAHIVPPTGAKGLNLAVADVRVLAQLLDEFYETGRMGSAQSIFGDLPARVLESTTILVVDDFHVAPALTNDNPFDERRQIAELDYVTSSRAASQTLAENYVGLPMD